MAKSIKKCFRQLAKAADLERRDVNGVLIPDSLHCGQHDATGYTCTRPKGHQGMHIAMGTGVNICAIWGMVANDSIKN